MKSNIEYINKDKLVGLFLDKKYSSTESKIEYGEAIQLINSFPNDKDVIRIVRCEDCRNGDVYSDAIYCSHYGRMMDYDDYCSYSAE